MDAMALDGGMLPLLEGVLVLIGVLHVSNMALQWEVPLLCQQVAMLTECLLRVDVDCEVILW